MVKRAVSCWIFFSHKSQFWTCASQASFLVSPWILVDFLSLQYVFVSNMHIKLMSPQEHSLDFWQKISRVALLWGTWIKNVRTGRIRLHNHLVMSPAIFHYAIAAALNKAFTSIRLRLLPSVLLELWCWCNCHVSLWWKERQLESKPRRRNKGC